MKTTIPTNKTHEPSREGLAYHEIVADGLVHSAHVFGIADDERFVERVLCIAWVNAARLVQSNFWQAARLAKSLSATLEVGKAQSESLCREVAEAITSSRDGPIAAIRAYYGESRQCRALDRDDSNFSDDFRQLIGEALLGGLYSRASIPDSFQAIVAQSECTRNEQRILSNRLIFWADNRGLPRFHPFMELCVSRYSVALERDLLCAAISSHLPATMDQKNPWSLDHWLKPGWLDGILAAKFAPDEVNAAIRALPAASWALSQRLFTECVQTTCTADEKVNLRMAFDKFVEKYNPCGFAGENESATNPRLLVWCGYDFAFWMGVVAELVRPQKAA